MQTINPFDLEYDLQLKLSNLFWKRKWGYLPTRVEPIVRKMTLEDHRIESEADDKEFAEFVNKYLNDSVFRAGIEQGK